MSDEGGDPACWLGAVCEHCGALVEDAAEHRCRRPVDAPADDTVDR